MRDKVLKHIFYYALPLIVLSIFAGSYFRVSDNHELDTLDLRFQLRPAQHTTDKVAIIEIGDDTIKNLGKWPMDRNYHAFLIKALSSAGAKAIVFDIFFSEPREYDNELEGEIKAAGNVYIPFVFDMAAQKSFGRPFVKGYIARNLAGFSKAVKGEGYINIIPDPDGKFRRIPLTIKYNGAQYPYISYLVACDYLGIKTKAAMVPLDESGNMIINFSGKWDKTYSHYSYADILQSYMAAGTGKKPILDLKVFKDKVCIIGLTATGTVDLHPTPFEPLYPAMGIHAEVFNSIINQKFITRLSKWWNLGILVILSILLSLVSLKTKPIKALVMLAGESVLLIAAGIILFDMFGIWIDLFYPLAVLMLLYISFTLYRYAAEWKKRLLMENELEIAKKIQESFLPKALPKITGADISASMFTARQVGGDLYDFIEFGDSKLGVMIGDVSGKGVPASLFMAMVAGAFKSFAQADIEPRKVLADLNNKLVRESSSGLFVTMFYAILDLKNNTVVYANGGHLPAIHLSGNGESKFLDTEDGAPLSLFEGEYSGGMIDITKGDTIVFYTDGVTEAMNTKGEMYGKERLSAVIKKNKLSTSGELLAAIGKDVRSFELKSGQHDDITVITVKVT